MSHETRDDLPAELGADEAALLRETPALDEVGQARRTFEIDHRFGRIMNANLQHYHVPVNADIHSIETIFVEEDDTIVNPLGVKGMGELGMVGIPAAIANAIFHATGKRVRDLPISPEKLM